MRDGSRSEVQGQRVFVLGATGTIGQATVQALVARGHDVTCFLRQEHQQGDWSARLGEATLRFGDVTNPQSLNRDGFRGEGFDAIVSCLASRSGAPKDSRAIDYQTHADALPVIRKAGIKHFVLLSAICVQRPKLAFQQAKLAAEQAVIASGLRYSIVRPTAFFKSLSGQIDRVRQGKSFLVFGNGTLTACKPISDADLGAYLADCLTDRDRYDQILPIGGPGEPITPLDQADALFRLTGRTPKIKHVPIAMMDTIIAGLSLLGRVVPPLRDKAELARIGRYYATESMLVYDTDTGQYDAKATPSTGSDHLFDFYESVLSGQSSVDLGDHAVFSKSKL